jgi:hypothetical protein
VNDIDPTTQLLADLEQHLKSRQMRETAQGMEDKYKKRIKDTLPYVNGTEKDSKGSYIFNLDGKKMAGKYVSSVKLERRSSLTLVPEKVEELLPKEFYSKVFRVRVEFTVPSELFSLESISSFDQLQDAEGVNEFEVTREIDEDALLALNYSDLLSDELLKQMYEETRETFALKVAFIDD